MHSSWSKIATWIATIGAFGLASSLQSQEAVVESGTPNYTIFEPEVTGIQSGINSLGLDRLGRLIATSGTAIVTFDGSNWRNYAQKSKDEKNALWLLNTAVGPDGSLYATTEGGVFLVRFLSNDQFELEPLVKEAGRSDRDFDNLTNIIVTEDSFYFYGSSQMAHYKPSDGILTALSEQEMNISHISASQKGLEVHSSDGGIYLYANSNWETTFPAQSIQEQEIIQTSDHWEGNGVILGSVFRGLFKVEDDSIVPWETEVRDLDRPGILDLEVFRDDYLAVAVQSFGIALINRDGDIVQVLNRQQDYRLGEARNLFYAGGDTLWAVLDKSLLSVQLLSPLSDYSPLSPYAVLFPEIFRHRGKAHMITQWRLFRTEHYRGGGLKGYTEMPTMPDEAINHCTSVDEGILYSSTTGIFLLDDNMVNHRIADMDDPNLLMKSDKHPDVIIIASNSDFSLLRRRNGEWHHDRETQFVGRACYEFSENAEGGFWVENGVSQATLAEFKDDSLTIRTFDKEDGIIDGWVNIWRLDDTTYFSNGTNSNYLYWNSVLEKFEVSEKIHELIGDEYTGVSRPAMDANGNVWVPMYTNHGILRKQPDGSFISDRYSLREIDHTFLYNMWPEDNGGVWLRARTRIYRYEPSLEVDRSYKLVTEIYQVELQNERHLVFDSRTDEGIKTLALPYSMNSLRFNLATPHFNFHRGALVQTRLTGFDEEWSTLSNRDTVAYSNLDEGSYEFDARSTLDGENFSPVSSISFKIAPPYYRTTVAYTLYFVTFIIVIAIIAYYIRRSADVKNQTLQKLVNERTQKLDNTNNELKIMVKKAEAASQAKGAFLATISHEIRTPLNSIIGPTEILLTSEHLEAQEKFFYLISNAGKHLLNLIDDLLEFASNNTKAKPINHAAFDLRSMIEELSTSYTIQAQEKGLAFKYNLDKNFPRGWSGDAKLLRQMTTNLLNNAIKYTQEGRVEMTTSRTLGDKGENRLLVSISDTGIGISDTESKAIFDPFYQVDDSYTRTSEGTGLGLAICKQLADRMNGNIGFESVLGEGSRFWFSIPMEPIEDVRRSSQSRPCRWNDSNFEDVAVLLVEDDESNRQIAFYILEAMGCKVTIAVNGIEAIHKCNATQFDIVLMDIRMPEMNGIDATRAIKESGNNNSDTPILILSAFLSCVVKDKCENLGIRSFLSKPIYPEQLAQAISNSLKRN